jgi:hypothetical protein
MRDAINKCPGDQWRTGDVVWLKAARPAYHATQACAMYGRPGVEGLVADPIGRCGPTDWHDKVCWEGVPGTQLPSRQTVLERTIYTLRPSRQRPAVGQWRTRSIMP